MLKEITNHKWGISKYDLLTDMLKYNREKNLMDRVEEIIIKSH